MLLIRLPIYSRLLVVKFLGNQKLYMDFLRQCPQLPHCSRVNCKCILYICIYIKHLYICLCLYIYIYININNYTSIYVYVFIYILVGNASFLDQRTENLLQSIIAPASHIPIPQGNTMSTRCLLWGSTTEMNPMTQNLYRLIGTLTYLSLPRNRDLDYEK